MTQPETVTRRELTRPLRLCLAGAPPDTGNLGVQALYVSVVAGLARHARLDRVSVLDNGWGVRGVTHEHGTFPLDHCGARLSRRWHRPDTWANIRACAAAGGLGNPLATTLRTADAVLDVSAGDSFSDIYGRRRFRATVAPKKAAIAMRRPLILLPQTYGPFRDRAARAIAERVVREAAIAYSRDDVSHGVLLELLGADADVARHRRGVDLAFALEPEDPGDLLESGLRAALEDDSPGRTRIGINISGLIYNDQASSQAFGLALDYPRLMRRVVKWFVNEGCEVFLVPHVAASPGNDVEDDSRACRRLVDELDVGVQRRVRVVNWGAGPGATKWIISRMSWFCGTRMHSTIASLSSLVPTVAIAYSMKTRGVFDTCGMGTEVIEARCTGEEESLRRIQDSWERRERVREVLATRMEPIREQASAQLAHVVSSVAVATR